MEQKEQQGARYTMLQNAWYMVRLAWRERKSVLWLCLALAGLHVAISLAELFLAPLALGKVEAAAPLPELFGTIAAMAGTLALLRAVRAYIDQNTLFGRVQLRTSLDLQVITKAVSTSYPNSSDPRLLQEKERADRALDSNSSAGEAIWRVMTEIFQNLLGFGIYLALFLSLDPVLILLAVATAALSYVCSLRTNKWSYDHRQEGAALGQKMSYIRQTAGDRGALKDIQIFGMSSWLRQVHDAVLKLFRDFQLREQRVRLLGDLAEVALTFLRNGAAYGYLLALALGEGLSVSEFLLYFTAVGNFTTWVTGILKGFGELHQFSLELSSVRGYIEAPEPFRMEGGKAIEPDTSLPYTLELRDVSFRYPNTETWALRHVNMKFQVGSRLAVVGENGSGKTTFIKLLCRLYDPTQGEILLNGIDIRKYSYRQYIDLFSVVFQDFQLLAFPLGQNVAAAVEVDKGRAARCLEMAGFGKRLAALPQGLETPLYKEFDESGVQVSGGEAQKIALARALYKDAPFVVLDEPTAALDPVAEMEVYENFDKIVGDKTAVYISHRLSSCRFCDDIAVFDHGHIVQQGSHDALVEAPGKYQELWHAQAQYYAKQEKEPGVE